MKKILLLAALTALFRMGAYGAVVANYQGPITNEAGLAYSKDYDIDLNGQGVDSLSVQAVYSTATIAAATFIDGTRSTGQVTIASGTACVGSRLIIGSIALTEGIDWTKAATSTGTALNLCQAMQSNPYLSQIITSTIAVNSAVIYATSTAVGTAVNYYFWSSTPTAMTVSSSTFLNGTDTKIDYTNDIITATNNGMTTALPVLFTVTAGVAPTGLTANVTYYAIPGSTVNTFKLAATSTGAVAGTSVDLVEAAAVGSSSFKATPIPLSGNATFYFMYSNDGVNFIQHPTASSATVTAATVANSTFGYDFGTINWHYLRLRFLKPTWGAIRLVITGNGKKK